MQTLRTGRSGLYSTRRSQQGSALKGCLIALGVVVLVAIVLSCAGGIWLYFNWKWAFGSSFGAIAKQAVNETTLPDEQKKRINVQIDRVVESFVDGSLTEQKAQQLIERIANSPIVPYAISEAVKANYVQQSTLADEQKQMVIDQTQRLMRGVIDKKIDQGRLDQVLGVVSNKKQDGSLEVKQNLTDEELLKFAEEAKQAADDAGVADQVQEVDLAAEIEKIVADVLGGSKP